MTTLTGTTARERFRGLKVLPLEVASAFFKGNKLTHEFFRKKWEDENRYYGRAVPVVVGRDGLYRKGDVCWYEFEGVAYKSCPDMFRYNEGLLEAERLLHYRDALGAICLTNLATKKQRKMHGFIELFFYYREQRLGNFKEKKKRLIMLKRSRGIV